VDIVVSGDFKQADGQSHLTLNLVDARSLRQLGSRQLSEPSDRLPYLQQSGIAALVEMLGASLSAEQEAMLTEGGTMSANAYKWYLKGEAALDRFDQPEQVDMSLEFFQWALDEDSLFALAHAGLGEAAMRKYKDTRDVAWVEQAKSASMRALDLTDRLADVRVTLGRLYDFTGDYAGAVREFSLATEIDSRNADGYFGLARALAVMGRAEQAEAHFNKALELQPSDWQYNSEYGVFLLREGRYRESARQFERVIKLSPDNLIGYNNLASAYLYLEAWGRAEAALERGNAIMPTWQAYSNLGYIHYVNGRFGEEAQTYERALALDSTDYSIWGNLAAAYFRSGEDDATVQETYERAASLAQRHLSVNPADVWARMALADYQLGAGHDEEAKSTLNRAVRADGLSVDLMAEAGTLYERLGHREQALRWLQRAVQNGYPAEHLDMDDNLAQLLADIDGDTVDPDSHDNQ
jgi:serine/threonine-protein kinase